MTFRSKSPARVVDDLTTLSGRYRHLDFQVVDNILAVDYLREVLPRLRESGYDLRIFWETKSNLKKEQVRLFRDAGVVEIQPGIESLSTPISRTHAKRRDGLPERPPAEMVRRLSQIQPVWNLIYGFPGEPQERIRADG